VADRSRLFAGGVLAGAIGVLTVAVAVSMPKSGGGAEARQIGIVPVQMTAETSLALEPPREPTTTAPAVAATPQPLPPVVSADPVASEPWEEEPEPESAAPTTVAGGPRAPNAPPARPVNVPQGELVCPIIGEFWHVDDFYAPRAGGKVHYANDLIADEGTPVVALSDGFVRRVDRVDNFDGERDKGGITITFDTVAGDIFYYAHLATVDATVSIGSPISAGDVLGLVGSTGNAAWSVPHLHLSWRPQRGEYANPYPLVRELCGPNPPNRRR
jgi:peptidoglycan LD-endopeptidase LytH